MKTCKTCQQEKSETEFHRRKRSNCLLADCKPCHNKQARDKRKADPVRWKDYIRRGNYRTRHGIEFEEFQRLAAEQSNTCGICREPNPSQRQLSLDHDHKTGFVRGILCDRCNRGLGLFRDNPGLLDAAAAYLRDGGSSHIRGKGWVVNNRECA